jgi:hypothetical protein
MVSSPASGAVWPDEPAANISIAITDEKILFIFSPVRVHFDKT